MANLEKTRLFNVRCGARANIIYSQIEAVTAEEAIRKSDRREDQIVSQVDSEPIYNASIGVETDASKHDTGNSIFEINVRGTDEVLVDKLRNAIARAIGGMAVEFEGLTEDGGDDDGRSLRNFIDGTGLNVVGL